MPKLEPEVEDINTVDEKFRSLYEKDEESGAYVLDVDVTKHRGTTALRSSSEKNAAAAKAAKAYTALGLKPDEIKEKLASIESLETQIAELKANKGTNKDEDKDGKKAAALRDQLEKERDAAVTAEKAETAKWRGKFELKTLSDDLRKSALDAGMLPEEVEDQIELQGKHFRVIDGKTTHGVMEGDDFEASGTSLKRFWEDFKKAKPTKFKSRDANGGGSKPSDRTASDGGAVPQGGAAKIRQALNDRER